MLFPLALLSIHFHIETSDSKETMYWVRFSTWSKQQSIFADMLLRIRLLYNLYVKHGKDLIQVLQKASSQVTALGPRYFRNSFGLIPAILLGISCFISSLNSVTVRG